MNNYKITAALFFLCILFSCDKYNLERTNTHDPESKNYNPLPELTTAAVTIITGCSATTGGNVTYEGKDTVIARGVCWSTSNNPTITLTTKTVNGTRSGIFESSIKKLTANTKYYARAYATNIEGTTYGNEISFTTTSATAPTLSFSKNYVTPWTSSTATFFTLITSNGGATVTSCGVCWSTSSNPTIANSNTLDDPGTGYYTSSVTGLTLFTTYYIRAYATNSAGTTYSTEISFATTILIGDSYQGGIVAYKLGASDPGYVEGQTHGLIAAPSDQSTNATWWNGTNTTTGATGTALGTGQTNTTAIIASQGNTGSYAAKICQDLVLGGYSDWYLPSKDELDKLYRNHDAIGGFSVNDYWSSTENDNTTAWTQYFFLDSQSWFIHPIIKNYLKYVRAVRTF
jgi:hypothetical protein